MRGNCRAWMVQTMAVILGLLVASVVHAQEKPIPIAAVKRDGKVSFEKDILPILQKNCVACHNSSEAEAELVLETPEAIRKGGDSGPAVVPGKPQESLLLKVAAHQQEPFMPPEDNDVNARNLTPEELGLIQLWIQQGATGTVSVLPQKVQWQPLPPGVNPVYSVSLSQDGRFLAVARANQVFLYHVPSGQLLGRLTDPELLESGVYKKPGVAHLDLVQAVAFSPDAQLLATGGFQVVKLWQYQPPGPVRNWSLGMQVATAAVHLPKGLLAAAQGQQVALWDLNSGQQRSKLSGAQAPLLALEFSKDGQSLYGCDKAKRLYWWNLAEGKLQATFSLPHVARAIAWVGDGSLLATGGDDNKVHLWKIVPHQPQKKQDAKKEGQKPSPAPAWKLQKVRTLSHGGVVNVLRRLENNPTQLFAGSEDRQLVVWNTANGGRVRALSHRAQVTKVAISASAARVASADTGGALMLWNASNGTRVAELRGDPRIELQLAVLAPQRQRAQVLRNLFNNRLNAAKQNLPKRQEAVKKAQEAFTKAQKEFQEKQTALDQLKKQQAELNKLVAQADQQLQVLKKQLEETKKQLAQNKNDQNLKKKQQELEQKIRQVQAQLQDAEKKRKGLDKPLADAQKALQSAQGAHDTARRQLTLVQRDLKQLEEQIPQYESQLKNWQQQLQALESQIQKLNQQRNQAVVPVALAFQGPWLAVADKQGRVFVRDGLTGGLVEVFQPHQAQVVLMEFLPNGQLLSVGADGSVRISRPLPQWTLKQQVPGFVDRVLALDFSPDGKLLAAGSGEPSRSGQLRVLNAETGDVVLELPEAHSDTIFSVAFSPQGDMIATAGADKFARVFRLPDGKQFRRYEGHTHHVLGVAWRYDSEVLATCGADLAIKVWDIPRNEQRRSINNVSGKQLTNICFVGVSSVVAVSAGDACVEFRNVDNGGRVRRLGAGSDFVHCVDATPDARWIAAGGQDGTAWVWNNRYQLVHTLSPPSQASQ